MSRFVLSRRTVLRGLLAGGASVTVGLPMLEAMLNNNGTALAGGAPIPLRFVTYFFGNGFVLPKFVPATTGPNWELTEQLAPLAPVKEYCNVITGFDNKCEKLITHHEGMTMFNGYTFLHQGGLTSKAGGPTIDQVIADTIEASGTVTPVKSVQIGISRELSYMDGGTTMHNLSHRGPDNALPPEFNPQKMWQILFGNFTPMDDPSGPLRASVLDAVKAQTDALKKRLGTKDVQRLDAHLEGINEVQKKIEAIPPVCQPPGLPSETNPPGANPEPLINTNKVMADLIAYAFECDVTRVVSVLLVGGAAGTVLKEAGLNDEHHLTTHNAQKANTDINAGVIFQMQRFSDFLQTLKAKTDPTGGNLLDNTIVYFSSDCSEGWSHSVKKTPMIVAGKGAGYLKYPGIHYASTTGQNPSDVLLTCARAFNPNIPSIGAGQPMSTTPFTDIMG